MCAACWVPAQESVSIGRSTKEGQERASRQGKSLGPFR